MLNLDVIGEIQCREKPRMVCWDPLLRESWINVGAELVAPEDLIVEPGKDVITPVDIVLIDGLYLAHLCLDSAYQWLKPEGVIFLLNEDSTRYVKVIRDHYVTIRRYSEHGQILWKGRIQGGYPPWIETYMKGHVCPNRVVILAKGPSMDRYDPTEFAADFIVGVNEAGVHFPCDMAVYMDGSLGSKIVYSVDKLIVRPAVRWLQQEQRGYTSHLNMTAPFAILGTVSAAMYLLAKWGVRDFVLCGCDSFGAVHEEPKSPGDWYAKCLDRPIQNTKSVYTRINLCLQKIIDLYDLKVVWWHQGI